MRARSQAKRARPNDDKSSKGIKNVRNSKLPSGLKATTPFLQLPLEIRNMIYGYYLAPIHTKNPAQALIPISHQYAEDIRARASRLPQSQTSVPLAAAHWIDVFYHWRDPIVLDTTLMQTCKSVFGEINDFIYRNVQVELRMWSTPGWKNEESRKLEWTARDKVLLRNAQRIRIGLDLSDWFSGLWPTAPPDIATQLQKRKNLLELEFKGAGWRAFERRGKRYVIERILRQFSNVKARGGVKFSWYGDADNPTDRTRHYFHDDALDWAEWYRGRVASLANQKW